MPSAPVALVDASRALGLYLVWSVLAGGRPDLLLVGVPACLLVAVVSRRVGRRHVVGLRIASLVAYVPRFLWRSLAGGIDVAWRVLHPRLPIAPAFMRHRFEMPQGDAEVLFCDVLSLMPGTLCAGIEGRDVVIHLLVDEPAARSEIVDEEGRIQRLMP